MRIVLHVHQCGLLTNSLRVFKVRIYRRWKLKRSVTLLHVLLVDNRGWYCLLHLTCILHMLVIGVVSVWVGWRSAHFILSVSKEALFVVGALLFRRVKLAQHRLEKRLAVLSTRATLMILILIVMMAIWLPAIVVVLVVLVMVISIVTCWPSILSLTILLVLVVVLIVVLLVWVALESISATIPRIMLILALFCATCRTSIVAQRRGRFWFGLVWRMMLLLLLLIATFLIFGCCWVIVRWFWFVSGVVVWLWRFGSSFWAVALLRVRISAEIVHIAMGSCGHFSHRKNFLMLLYRLYKKNVAKA